MNQQMYSPIGLAYLNLKDMRNNNNNSNHSKYHSNHIATPWQPLIDSYFLMTFSCIVQVSRGSCQRILLE